MSSSIRGRGGRQQRERKSPAVLVRPNVPYTGNIETAGFTGSYENSVTVLVCSRFGVSSISYIPYFPGNPETKEDDDVIVVQTRDIEYLERNRVDPRLPEIKRRRAAAIRDAICVDETRFTMADEILHFDNVDFRKIVATHSKKARQSFRDAHPLDKYSAAELLQPKRCRRRLKAPQKLSDEALREYLKEKCPLALAGQEAYRAYANGALGTAAADAVVKIPNYVVRGGILGDREQVRTNLITSDEPATTSIFQRLMKLLLLGRTKSSPLPKA